MSTINSATTVAIPQTFNFGAVSAATSSVSETSTHSPSDAFAGNSYSASSSGSTDPNAKAGFAKRMMHGIGNGIGRIADMMGLGTISKFAKDNFRTYDTNNDNKIIAGEFSAVSALVNKTFEQVDSNANQEVSFGEFKSLVRDLVDAELQATDTDGDGFVNRNEATVRGLITTQGQQDSFTVADKNTDGLLSFTEFANMVNSRKFNKAVS